MLPGSLKEPYWSRIIAWSIVFIAPSYLVWLLSNWCAKKATLMGKQKLKEVQVSEGKVETAVSHSAPETDDRDRVDEVTLPQKAKTARAIQREHKVQISLQPERIPQKQRTEAVVIDDRGASCSHRNVMHVPVFQVKGEPRRVIKKCLDCGKVLKKDRIGR